MKITYYGHSCFKLESENGQSIITDPFTKVGYELPKGLAADILTVSHGHFDHNYVAAISGEPIVLGQSGDFSVNGISIVGTDSWHDPKQGVLRGGNVIFKYIIDGMTICHFGDLGEGYSQEIADKIGEVDLCLIPVGGTYTIDAAQAIEYIKELKPKAVIPMHYRPQDGALDITGIEVFLEKIKEMPIISCLNGEYSLSKEQLSDAHTQIIYMERRKK